MPAEKPTFLLAIIGSRTFDDLATLTRIVDAALANKAQTHDIIILCGMARGADLTGKEYARIRGYSVMPFPANWKEGRGAGFRRNERMLAAADAVVAFWDCASHGTQHAIATAESMHIPIKAYTFDGKLIAR